MGLFHLITHEPPGCLCQKPGARRYHFETQSLLFGALAIPNKINNVDFFPEVNEASIYIKQMEAMAGERKAVRIQLVDDNNLSMVFARVMTGDTAALVFGNSEKSGGLITPTWPFPGFQN
jgi:hypothetical protein